MSLFKVVDKNLRSVIGPTSASKDSDRSEQDQKTGRLSDLSAGMLAFITTLLGGVLLSRQKQAALIPIVLLVCWWVALVAPKKRRAPLLAGVVIATPLNLIGWFVSLGPFR
jgi:4-amino-4-deoxy-L-arabinose transferase-like glycosyltransferase